MTEALDFTDPFLNEAGIPHEAFAELRRTASVSWIEQEPGSYEGMKELPVSYT